VLSHTLHVLRIRRLSLCFFGQRLSSILSNC
jgi:hypothetical protein